MYFPPKEGEPDLATEVLDILNVDFAHQVLVKLRERFPTESVQCALYKADCVKVPVYPVSDCEGRVSTMEGQMPTDALLPHFFEEYADTINLPSTLITSHGLQHSMQHMENHLFNSTLTNFGPAVKFWRLQRLADWLESYNDRKAAYESCEKERIVDERKNCAEGLQEKGGERSHEGSWLPTTKRRLFRPAQARD